MITLAIILQVRLPWPSVDRDWIAGFIDKERASGRLFSHELGGQLLYNLKTARIDGFYDRAEDIALVKFLFDRAVSLEKLFVYSIMGCMTRRHELLHDKLTSLHRRSPTAQVIVENGLRQK